MATDARKPSWSPAQRRTLRVALDAGLPVAYVVTDAWGRPSNGGSGTVCSVGAVQEIAGPLKICTAGALHGTPSPHRWRGVRVWVAIFHGEVQRENDKIGALRREIIGELHPDDVIDASAAARMGLSGANLHGADLYGADLHGADLYGADLHGANLHGANLPGANLSGANLYGANLSGANLYGANLYGADLHGANLSGAYLWGADLSGAYLSGADLSRAYLSGANLPRADLRGADLWGANLLGANLSDANLSGAYCPCPPPGWVADADGYLSREMKHD